MTMTVHEALLLCTYMDIYSTFFGLIKENNPALLTVLLFRMYSTNVSLDKV